MTSPLRVAFVTGGLHLGGTTTFLCNLAGELIRRGVRAEVFSLLADHPLARDFESHRVPVHRPVNQAAILEDRLARVLAGLATYQPSVVVANISASSFEVLRYAPPGVLRVGTVQSDDDEWYQMLCHYADHMDAVAAVSETIKLRVQTLPGFEAMPVHHLPYGVPIPSDDVPRDWLGPRGLRILYMGRLDHQQKRVRLFPDFLRQLAASGISFHWTIAGEGPDEEFLRKTMHSLDAQRTVCFTGKVAYTEVPQLLSSHDVFLLASDYEGLPLALLEAMASGMVPVVSDLESGIRQVVDAGNGMLVETGNLDGYVKAIVWIHEHRPEASRMSVRARECVSRAFSVQAMTDRWMQVLDSNPGNSPDWPSPGRVLPPLVGGHRFYFSEPVRTLRRLALRLR